MKENGHRIPQVCDKSGVESRSCTARGRADGYRLYNPTDLPGEALSEAGRRPLRHAPRQLGRGGDPDQGPRRRARPDRGPGGVRGGWAPARQGAASDRGGDPATRLWDCLWVRRCNDAARLADDVIHKLLLDRDPIAGPALASQPTLSRFENAVGPRELIAMGHVLADTVIVHHRRRLKGRAERITIDF